MKRISLYINQLQLKRLGSMSASTGAPVAELIRRAIDILLKRSAKR